MKAILFIPCFLFALSLSAQTFVLNQGHAEVHGRTHLNAYTGVSEALEGTINIESKEVDFRLKLETLKTGNNKRDRDMYKTLDVSSHPYAEFQGHLTSPFDPDKKGSQNVTVKGNFSIHGETKEIEVNGTLETSEKGLKLDASFPVNITEYGMKRPHVLAYKTEDKHTIQVRGELKEEKSTVRTEK